MESTDSSTAGSHQPHLPPGFRFHPTDEELVVHYLKRKAASAPLPVAIIADIDLYKFDPWELPAKATFGEQEWYFFSPRDRKYPNGLRPNRAATSGYWKATGTDKPVLTAGGTQKVGVKKALVFYGGKPPKGIKTNWIMHEYRLTDGKSNTKSPVLDIASKKGSLRLDDWVLCRIHKKNTTQRPIDRDDTSNDIITSIPSSINPTKGSSNYGAMLENDHQNLFQGMTNGGDEINNNGSLSQFHISNSNSNLNSMPMKQMVPSPYWNGDNDEETGMGARVEENSSIVSLLSQLTQTPTVHQQTYQQSPMGYQLQGLNWYS